MARRSQGMRFNQPLAGPESQHVEWCYAAHGKGFGHSPPREAAVRVLGVSEQLEVRWAPGYNDLFAHLACAEFADYARWRMLGWVMADDSLPLGPLESVDPRMAQWFYLPPAHFVQPVGHGCIGQAAPEEHAYLKPDPESQASERVYISTGGTGSCRETIVYDGVGVGEVRLRRDGWYLTLFGFDLGCFRTFYGARRAALTWFDGLDIIPWGAEGPPRR